MKNQEKFCANCGKKAVRIVEGKEKPLGWCNSDCQREWLMRIVGDKNIGSIMGNKQKQ